MDKETHAKKIMDLLYGEYDWEEVKWKVKDKPKSYYLILAPLSGEALLTYKIMADISPETYAKGIHEGDIGPFRAWNKVLEEQQKEQEKLYIKSLPRRERRRYERMLKKKKKVLKWGNMTTQMYLPPLKDHE